MPTSNEAMSSERGREMAHAMANDYNSRDDPWQAVYDRCLAALSAARLEGVKAGIEAAAEKADQDAARFMELRADPGATRLGKAAVESCIGTAQAIATAIRAIARGAATDSSNP